MTSTAIFLIVLSAVLHAGWNLLSKSRYPTSSFFLLANSVGSLLLAPVLVFYGEFLHAFPTRIWALLLVTGFFQALYYASLAGAYRFGNLSVAYPLARSSPVIVVTVVTLLMGRGDQVTAQCIAGILLVVAGCFLIPMRRFSDFRLANYLNPTCGLALLAAVGTTGYSIIDDEGLRLLRTSTALSEVGNTPLTLIYACMEAFISSLWLLPLVFLRREGRATLSQLLRSDKGHASLAGIMIYLTYILVLVSMAFVTNVSYVVAFRQLSIPLGTLLGIGVLREPAHPPKLVGVGVMFVGLVLVGSG